MEDMPTGEATGARAAVWSRSAPAAETGKPDRLSLAGVVLLVGLANVLFFGRDLGLSLAAFSAVLLVLCGPRQIGQGDFATVGLLALVVLPVVELVPGLSVDS